MVGRGDTLGPFRLWGRGDGGPRSLGMRGVWERVREWWRGWGGPALSEDMVMLGKGLKALNGGKRRVVLVILTVVKLALWDWRGGCLKKQMGCMDPEKVFAIAMAKVKLEREWVNGRGEGKGGEGGGDLSERGSGLMGEGITTIIIIYLFFILFFYLFIYLFIIYLFLVPFMYWYWFC